MDKNQFYCDNGVSITAEEIKKFVGVPVCVEHDSKRVIGEVTYAHTDKDGKIQIEWRQIACDPGAPRPDQKE